MPVASHESSRSVYEPDVKFWGVHVLRRIADMVACMHLCCVGHRAGWVRRCAGLGCTQQRDDLSQQLGFHLEARGEQLRQRGPAISSRSCGGDADIELELIIIVAFTPVLAFSAITL